MGYGEKSSHVHASQDQIAYTVLFSVDLLDTFSSYVVTSHNTPWHPQVETIYVLLVYFQYKNHSCKFTPTVYSGITVPGAVSARSLPSWGWKHQPLSKSWTQIKVKAKHNEQQK